MSAQPIYNRDPFESDQPRHAVVEAPPNLGNPTSSKHLTIRGRRFELNSEIDGLSLLEFAAASSADENDEKAAMAAIRPMLSLVEAIFTDYPSFREFSRQERIGIEEIGSILGDAVALYSGHPTQGSAL